MSFKNAFKIFMSKFSIVWVLVLYILISGALITLVALPFVLIIYKTIINAGFADKLEVVYLNLINGGTLQEVVEQTRLLFLELVELFNTNLTLSITSTLFVAIVVIFVVRFFGCLYELPLTKVLDNYMSSNARTGFTSNFISTLGKSVRYSLAKMIYTLIIDVIIILIIDVLFFFFKVPILTLFAPFIIMTVAISMLSLKNMLTCMWAPYFITDKKPLFISFGYSVKMSTKNFSRHFGVFFITWVLIITLNLIVGIFTLGAGLLATIPISMLFISVLNNTLFYNNHGRRYYIDETVYTPPTR